MFPWCPSQGGHRNVPFLEEIRNELKIGSRQPPGSGGSAAGWAEGAAPGDSGGPSEDPVWPGGQWWGPCLWFP